MKSLNSCTMKNNKICIILSDEMMTYVGIASVKNGCSKGEYIRRLLENDFENRDDSIRKALDLIRKEK